VERKFQERLRVTMDSALRRREKRDVRSFGELDAERKSKVLSALYEEIAGKEPKVGAPPPPPKELSRGERRAAKSAHEAEVLETATREQIQVEPEELDALGRERAQAIESALLASGKLDHTRILISREAKVSAEQGKVRFELGFE
jgi:hypothetical protein